MLSYFVIRRSDFVIFSLVIRAKTALVSASRFAARLRSARAWTRRSCRLANTEMRNRYLLMSILALASSTLLATSAFAAEATGTAEHEGVSLKPQMLFDFGNGFGITNSMLVTWIVAAGIIIFAQIPTR